MGGGRAAGSAASRAAMASRAPMAAFDRPMGTRREVGAARIDRDGFARSPRTRSRAAAIARVVVAASVASSHGKDPPRDHVCAVLGEASAKVVAGGSSRRAAPRTFFSRSAPSVLSPRERFTPAARASSAKGFLADSMPSFAASKFRGPGDLEQHSLSLFAESSRDLFGGRETSSSWKQELEFQLLYSPMDQKLALGEIANGVPLPFYVEVNASVEITIEASRTRKRPPAARKTTYI